MEDKQVHRDTESADDDADLQAVQAALNGAREYRDKNLIKPKSTTVKKYYNPDSDTKSLVSAVAANGEYRDANGRPMQVVAIPAGARIKNLVDDGSGDNSFPQLNYEEIQVNLRILSDLVSDEKICISENNKTIEIDKRYMQSIRRWYSGDSRARTLEFIKHVYAETEALCNDIVQKVKANQEPKENTEKLINLYSLIGSSGKGLDRLNITYQDDKTNSAKISTIKKSYETYCDRTLKGTIDGFKKNLE